MTGDSTRRARGLVLAIFFLSGVSGLVYQVIWVREFGNVFGNTVHSASLVAGVFMAGLGAGAYVLGRAGDRSFLADPRRPLRMYAASELAIALLGLLLSLILPRLVGLSTVASSYVTDERGWHVLSTGSYAVRYLVAVLLIAPATFLMGGTLTLLVRAVVSSDVTRAGDRVALLYGANTAGAAVGAFLTDSLLVPSLGIAGTQHVAVAINAFAGVSALALARAPQAPPTPVGDDAPSPVASPPPEATHALAFTVVALGLAGFAAMGFEILWFRLLSSALGERRDVFSLLLAVILAGIGVGAVVGARAHARWGRPALLLLVAECLFGVTALLLVGFVDARVVSRTGWVEVNALLSTAPAWERALREEWASLRPIVFSVGVPSVLMGASFPLANASIQRIAADVGARAGVLYLATCVANVLGCGLVGFLLLPTLGSQTSALVLAASAVLSSVPLFLSARPFADDAEARRGAKVAAIAGGVAIVGLSAFAALPGDHVVNMSLPLNEQAGTRKVLAVEEGVNETLAVTDVPGFFRELLTNGHPMSGTHPKAQRYMRAFAHVPLLQMDDPKSALVICFGVGITMNAAALHESLTRLDIADLSRNVLEHASWFEASNHDVLEDPRVSVFVNDGRHHILMEAEGTYDLITLEPPPIASAGVASLYSREFYELAKSRLTTRGFITQWLPAYQVAEEEVRAAVRAFIDVFPESVLLSGDDNELILMGTRGPSIQMDLDAVLRRLSAMPGVRRDMERVELGDPTDLAGMFAASHATMLGATRTVRPVTDDRPSLEYSVRTALLNVRMPRDLFDVRGIEAWCPGCLAKLPRLADYLRVRGAVYASDFFLATSSTRSYGFDIASVPQGVQVVAANPYLQTLLGGAALAAARAALVSERAGRLADALAGWTLVRSYDPSDPTTYDHLGAVLLRMGKPELASVAFGTAKQLRGEPPPARP